MVRILMFFAGVLLFMLSFGQKEQSQIHSFEKVVFINGSNEELPYRLMYPADYKATRKYPLVLFLHGAGSQGDDNEAHLSEVPQVLLNAAISEKYACFVLAPQCPKNDAWAWFPQYPLCSTTKDPSKSSRLTLELIDSLIGKLQIDQRRIYVTGLSLGGEGTFDIVTRRPHFFAAAVPVCGIADTSKADLMKNTPLWIFHGDSDNINPVDYSRNMVKALKNKGISPIYTEYKGVKHDSWTNAYQEPELLNWMFKQKCINHN